MKNVPGNTGYLVIFLFSITVIFIADILLSPGYAVWLLYFLPLLFAYVIPTNWIFRLAWISTALTIAGFFLELSGGGYFMSVFNRVIGVSIFWLFVFLIKGRKRIEEALKITEAELGTIFRAAPVGMGVLIDRRIMRVNEMFTTISGYTAEEARGKSSLILYPSKDEFDRVGRVKYDEIRRRGIGTMETRWKKKDGGLIDILLSSASIDTGDWSKGVIFTASDITARVRDMDEIFRQRQLFRTLTENSPDVIFMLDLFMRFTYINATIEKVTGKPPSFFIGKTFPECGLFPEQLSRTWETAFRKVLETGQTDTIEYSFPLAGTELYMIGKGIPLYSKEGKIESIVGFSHDITELKNIQRMLEKRAHESEEGRRILSALMEHVPEGIIIAEAPDVTIKMISRQGCELLGCKKEEIIGKSLKENSRLIKVYSRDTLTLVDPDDLVLSKAVKNGERVVNQEYVLKRFDGTVVSILASAAPIRDRNGSVTGGIVTWKDITQLKRAEEVLKRDRATFEKLVMERTRELVKTQLELEQAKRLSDIGSLAATVAHELRNPLGVIRTAAFNIKRKAAGAPIGGQLQNIDKKIDQSDHIINNLLFYARLRRPQFEPVKIYDVLRESIESFAGRFDDFTVKQDLGEIHDSVIDAEAEQIRELFINLISNAHDAVKEKRGTLLVRGYRQDAQVCVIFKDNGIGMSESEMAKTLEPFYTTKSRGTGLGLTVARQIVGLHKGTMDMQSSKGEGTEVTVRLPLRREAGSAQ